MKLLGKKSISVRSVKEGEVRYRKKGDGSIRQTGLS